MRITIFMPFRITGDALFSESAYNMFSSALKLKIEDTYLRSIEFRLEETNSIPTEVTAMLDIDDASQPLFRLAQPPRDYTFLKVSSELESDLENDQGGDYASKMAYFAEAVESASYKFFTALAITKSIGFQTRRGLLYIGDQLRRRCFPIDTDFIYQAAEFAHDNKLPGIVQLDLLKGWNWLASQQGFTEEFSINPISRAINIFTYLLFQQFNEFYASNLFWSVMALEAIYATGSESIGHQLQEKCSSFLGDAYIHKKKLNEMYGVRSRLIHGDLNLPPIFSQRDATEQFEKYEDRLLSANMYSTYLLIATLQKLCKENRTSLDFKVASYLTYPLENVAAA